MRRNNGDGEQRPRTDKQRRRRTEGRRISDHEVWGDPTRKLRVGFPELRVKSRHKTEFCKGQALNSKTGLLLRTLLLVGRPLAAAATDVAGEVAVAVETQHTTLFALPRLSHGEFQDDAGMQEIENLSYSVWTSTVRGH